MKRSLPFAVALAACQPAWANDLLKDLARQAANSILQQAPARMAEPAVSAPAGPPARAMQAAPAAQAAADRRPSASVAAGRTRLYFGGSLSGDYLVDYWNNPDAPARGDTPSEDAPGHVMTKPPTFGGNLKQAGAAAITKKLAAVVARLLEHPTLKGIRGSSVSPGGGVGRSRGGPMESAVAASASLLAYPIVLEDPKTMRFPDGTFRTPGEGDNINITVNDPDLLERLAPVGTYNGMLLVGRPPLYMLVIQNTGRPIYFTEGSGRQTSYTLNPDLLDPSRPRSEIQLMTIHLGMTLQSAFAIVEGKIKPTSGPGRLYGLMFNIDWPALLKEVNEDS